MSSESYQGKTYRGDGVDVSFDGKRCIHVGRCVRGLPAVFDTDRRPWILPANATPTEVAAVIARCPSGALRTLDQDGNNVEQPQARNVVQPRSDGPLWLRGDIMLQWQGEQEQGMRFALCRCGMSNNKPFCDNGHRITGFEADSAADRDAVEPLPVDEHGRLTVEASDKGPYQLSGNFEIVNGDGDIIFAGEKARLCRCGASSNKPFCDGTHKRIDFG